jgi:glycosyltransferase involved in cell wall biosynthesis
MPYRIPARKVEDEDDLLKLMAPADAPRALTLLIPDGLTLSSGRYRYDRQVVSGLRALGWQVDVELLDASFPDPSDGALEQAGDLLAARRDNSIVLVDGLALSALGEQIERVAHRLTVIGLVHHLLAAETGLDGAAVAAREGRAMRAATGLVASHFGVARGIAAYGVPRERIAIAQPGTDPAPRAEGSRSRQGARRSTPVELLCVGSLIARKGHDVLFDAVAELRLMRWHLTCVGSDLVAPDTVAALREQVEISGLTDAITLAGEIDDAALEQAYQRADVFVLATRYEGYGTTVSEALARGIPVVSTMAGAIPELVDKGGTIVPIDDTAALAAALEPMVSDHATRAGFAAAALSQGAALPRWTDTTLAVSEALVKFSAPAHSR